MSNCHDLAHGATEIRELRPACPREFVTYAGEKFWLQNTGRYFQSGCKDAAERLLHRRIWSDIHGCPVPNGFEVHHKDENWRNNAPDNLELKSKVEHMRAHMRERIARNPERYAAYLAKGRDAARVWHASPEGRAWHSRHAKQSWAVRQTTPKECTRCDRTFHSKRSARFCSSACAQAVAFRRYFDDERTCEGCNNSFIANRHRKTRFCSRTCSSRHQPRGFTARGVRRQQHAKTQRGEYASQPNGTTFVPVRNGNL